MPQLLFSIACFTGAALLFSIQPFISKMLLPALGGSAAVWNTCMVFFQMALLLGYLYAYAVNRYLRGRLKLCFHPLLLIIAAVALPISLQGIEAPAGEANPTFWLLGVLLKTVGAPFLILSGTAPMLQAWYAETNEQSARDPYFLYAASNLGSLLALVSYPLIVEPKLHLGQQSLFWTIGYFLLIGLTVICAVAVNAQSKKAVQPAAQEHGRDRPALSARVRWILLAFIPSSLLLGVTAHLTTDVAATPLFWIIPLALYLLTFVLAFQRLIEIPAKPGVALQALLCGSLLCVLTGCIVLGCLALTSENDIVVPVFALHLMAFFTLALLCHRELAQSRPSVRHLTEFYLFISLGGVLGGIFNALLAPLLFNSVVEYPLVLIAVCLVRPGVLSRRDRPWPLVSDIELPVILFMSLFLLDFNDTCSRVAMGFAVLAVGSFYRRPFRLTLGIVALMMGWFLLTDKENVLAYTRNFYGVLKVVAQDAPPLHKLYNGTTLHGSQSQDAKLRLRPLGYYHPEGPLGQLFAAVAGTEQTRRVGIVGLGAGDIACYGRAGEHWTFFEINPADIAVARDPKLFTFLNDCPVHADVVTGDARRSLAKQPDRSFDMIILDAFASDAVPIHLITRDAVELYLKKLNADGLIVFHVSSNYLDLAPVIGNIAASLNLEARRWADRYRNDSDDPKMIGREPSEWVVVGRDDLALANIAADTRWQSLTPSSSSSVWTDDYSGLIGVLAW